MRLRPATMAIILLGLLSLAVLFGIRLGAVSLSNRQLWDLITGADAKTSAIVFQLRLPRVALGVLAGTSLAVSGVVWQGILRNPLADPYLIGVSSGGALGAAVALFFGAQFPFFMSGVPFCALLGALAAVALVYALASAGGKLTVERLLLCGVAVSSLFSALLSLLMVSNVDSLAGITFWMLGGLGGRSWSEIILGLPYFLVGFGLILAQMRSLNVLQLGDEAARGLGVQPTRTVRWLSLGATLLTASTIANCGMIGFVGLMTPHLVRRLVGSDLRIVLPLSALLGATLLVLADLASRTLFAPTEIPVGILTALLGAPFFLYLVYRR